MLGVFCFLFFSQKSLEILSATSRISREQAGACVDAVGPRDLTVESPDRGTVVVGLKKGQGQGLCQAEDLPRRRSTLRCSDRR